MNSWNELDGSTFFNKIFGSEIAFGEIDLFSVTIDNNRPVITLEFDISEYPDAPPEKWKKSGFNTCRIGLNCSDIKNLVIKNIPIQKKLTMKILNQAEDFKISATNEDSLIEFTTTHPMLCGPSAYFNDNAK